MRAKALILVVLLVSYGAVGARQPAVRMAVPLPAPGSEMATALEISTVDRGQFVLSIIRTLFGIGLTEGDKRQRARLRELLASPSSQPGEMVPLPLDASIWRETMLQRPVPNEQLLREILADRSAALMYHGLAGLDDETLAWLGAERPTLQHLMRRAGAFSVFGPSVRVRGNEIVVPGGGDTRALWQALVGADPAKPASFVRRLFADDQGYLAWLYDSISQLDDARLKFATGQWLPAGSRHERLRALLNVFGPGGGDWNPETQPFTRRHVDPGLTLALILVNADGRPVGPLQRGFWDRIFEYDGRGRLTMPSKEASAGDTAPLDAAWLLSRIHRVPVDVGRRRLETFLYAQRMFPALETGDASHLMVLRAYLGLPSLMLTLERAGVRSIDTIAAAVTRAEALNDIGDQQRRRIALLQFQASLAIVDRITRLSGLKRESTERLVGSLARVANTPQGYEGRIAAWVRSELLPALPEVAQETANHCEDIVLAAMAGAAQRPGSLPVVEWEGRKYRVSAAHAEANRLRRARQRQGGLPLDRALAEVEKASTDKTELALAETLTSIVYAAYLGDPEGPALTSENVAARHDLEGSPGLGPRAAWKLPTDGQSGRGWRVTGSVLGLDVPLARMALRRMDTNVMPPEPRLVSAERQTAALSVALLNPAALTDATRDEIAAALGRGRARFAALGASRAEVDALAAEVGLSAWRREALAWTAVHDRERLTSQLSLVETMWLGKPRTTAAVSLDNWGAAVLSLNGCLCLAMPRPQPWETLAGRPSLGLLATRGADVAILVADMLAATKMPAEIAPGVIAYAMQEVMDQAQPAFFDDWSEFSRAAMAISRDTLADYIASQAAVGALLPARSSDNPQP